MRWVATSIVLVLINATIHPDEIRVKVISIADGDTITVLDAAKERCRIR